MNGDAQWAEAVQQVSLLLPDNIDSETLLASIGHGVDGNLPAGPVATFLALAALSISRHEKVAVPRLPLDRIAALLDFEELTRALIDPEHRPAGVGDQEWDQLAEYGQAEWEPVWQMLTELAVDLVADHSQACPVEPGAPVRLEDLLRHRGAYQIPYRVAGCFSNIAIDAAASWWADQIDRHPDPAAEDARPIAPGHAATEEQAALFRQELKQQIIRGIKERIQRGLGGLRLRPLSTRSGRHLTEAYEIDVRPAYVPDAVLHAALEAAELKSSVLPFAALMVLAPQVVMVHDADSTQTIIWKHPVLPLPPCLRNEYDKDNDITLYCVQPMCHEGDHVLRSRAAEGWSREAEGLLSGQDTPPAGS
ncbi:hypothetical protein ABH935_007071 [Catenulispora sp. GAS73]|uniref:hypothetical protein n=1 Tax=Catenulispora sp. GAS73 TaxID=3156269 RepID=UPI0035138D5F